MVLYILIICVYETKPTYTAGEEAEKAHEAEHLCNACERSIHGTAKTNRLRR